MLEALGGKAAHQADILKNGLGYGRTIQHFNRLLEELGVSDEVLLPAMQQCIAEKRMDEYGTFLTDFLAKTAGAKKSAVRTALSATKEWNFEEVLRGLTFK